VLDPVVVVLVAVATVGVEVGAAVVVPPEPVEPGNVWVGASWWSAGPWWGNYMYSLELPSGVGYTYYIEHTCHCTLTDRIGTPGKFT
jgi:hypothetical protein